MSPDKWPGSRRILFVIDSLGTGGAERSLAELLPTLTDAGLTPTIACLGHRPHGVERDVVRDGYDVRFLRSGATARVRELRTMVRTAAPLLVHSVLFHSDVTARLACARTGVPVLTSLVNASDAGVRRADPHVRRSRLRAVGAIDGWTARHLTEHFHAISHAAKDAAVEQLGIDASRVTVVERGRDPARLGSPSPERRRRAREQLGIPDATPVVLSVGRQEYQKGQLHLLHGFDEVRRHHPDALLLVAGRRGHASEALDAARAELAAPESVRMLDYRDDVPELLAAADVFAFPSLYEGLGGAVLEAMALALPVVASDLPVLHEVVEPDASAVLVPPADPRALADAVSGLLADRARAEALGTRGRAIFLERFTTERSNERMLALYRSLINRPA